MSLGKSPSCWNLLEWICCQLSVLSATKSHHGNSCINKHGLAVALWAQTEIFRWTTVDVEQSLRHDCASNWLRCTGEKFIGSKGQALRGPDVSGLPVWALQSPGGAGGAGQGFWSLQSSTGLIWRPVNARGEVGERRRFSQIAKLAGKRPLISKEKKVIEVRRSKGHIGSTPGLKTYNLRK